VVTSKRVGGVEERGGANANKDTRDCDCKDLSTRGGPFFQVPKDWEVKLGVFGDVFFQSFQKSKDWESFGNYWRCS
jgi:hypothetical protein